MWMVIPAAAPALSGPANPPPNPPPAKAADGVRTTKTTATIVTVKPSRRVNISAASTGALGKPSTRPGSSP